MREIWVTSKYSPLDIHHSLVGLNVSHSLVMASGTRNHHISKVQPKWVYVVGGMIQKRNAVLPNSVTFMVLPHSQLTYTNVPRFPRMDLEDALREMMLNPQPCVPRMEEPTIIQYVNMIAKPSPLNLIQTIVLSISPYDLRKKVNAMILDYFNSKVKYKAVVAALKDNYKTSDLVPILKKDGERMRLAVARSVKEDVKLVSAETGVATFDLNYLRRSDKEKT